MARPDPFLNMFKDIGFMPVRLPRADINPLLLLEKQGKDLNQLGDVETAMLGNGASRPPVKPDIVTAGSVQGSRTSRIRLSIGLDLLSGLISAMAGSSLNVSAGYNNAKTVRFEFSDVTVDRVDITSLDAFLGKADIREEMHSVERLMIEDKVCVVTATVKSKKFLVTAQDESGQDIKVDVPVIQNAVSGKLEVKTEGSSDTKVAYEGTTPVVFGIQAVNLFFDDQGNYTIFKALNAGEGAVRTLGRAAASTPELVEVPGIFADIPSTHAAGL